MILRKIYSELVGIRKELHCIRMAIEPKTMNVDVDMVMDEMAKKLERAFSAMPDNKE